jgi:hypothetical protein
VLLDLAEKQTDSDVAATPAKEKKREEDCFSTDI